MNKYLSQIYCETFEIIKAQKKIVSELQKKDKLIPDLYFSQKYWKNAHRMSQLEKLDNDVPFDPVRGGIFAFSSTVSMMYEMISRKFYINDKLVEDKEVARLEMINSMERGWQFVNNLKTDGFHELYVDRDRAKILAQTKCNFKVTDFKSPYKTMIVVYPEDLSQDFRDEYTPQTPVFTYCHHDTNEELLQINHYYYNNKEKNNVSKIADNYVSFGGQIGDFNLNIEESMDNYQKRLDRDGYNHHSRFYTRIAINSLMIATQKDWHAPVGKSYENDGRKYRSKVRQLLPNMGVHLPFTATKITMKLPTLTTGKSYVTDGIKTGNRQKWHTREAHWRRVRVGADRHHEWRWIDSYEVNKDIKPLEAIIVTQHKLNHDV